MNYNSFCSYDFAEGNEQEDFLSILYHACRGGVKIRATLDKSKSTYQPFSNYDYKKIKCSDMHRNVYTTVNTFKDNKRTNDNLYAYTGIYMDLDCHELRGFTTEKSMDITIKYLEHCYKKGLLLRPTMITCTGRGYGVYYILDSTIANTERAQKSISYFKYVRRLLFQRYKYILSQKKGTASVDDSVTDNARITRMPGTINQANNSWCHLIDINWADDGTPTYYSITDIAEGNHLITKIAAEQKNKPNYKVSFVTDYKVPILMLRLEKLKTLQQIRKINGTESYRENTCFVYYNTAMQLYGKGIAEKEMRDFNNNFSEPLPESELTFAMKSVNKLRCRKEGDEKTGGYYLTDKKIKDLLSVTKEENLQCGFAYSKRTIERAQTKKKNQDTKVNRNQQIIECVKENPDKTYQEIADLYNVNISTIKRILKNANVGRYKNKVSFSNTTKAQNMSSILSGIHNTEDTVLTELPPFAMIQSCLDAFHEQILDCRQNRPLKGQLVMSFPGDSLPSYG